MSEVDLPARLEAYDANITIQRLALDEDDVTYGRLPSFPAESKRGDSRHAWFVRHYGERCWELDALDPNVLRERVRQAIDRRLDHEAWERAEVAERAERDSLVSILNDWPTRRISGQASE
jgi:hypothetical protein